MIQSPFEGLFFLVDLFDHLLGPIIVR